MAAVAYIRKLPQRIVLNKWTKATLNAARVEVLQRLTTALTASRYSTAALREKRALTELVANRCGLTAGQWGLAEDAVAQFFDWALVELRYPAGEFYINGNTVHRTWWS